MKKFTLLLITLIGISCATNAQDTQWLNYTNGNQIIAMGEEEDMIWVGTNGGIVQINKTTGNPTFYNKANSGLPSHKIRTLSIDGNGIKWIGTEGFGLVTFDGTNWTVYNTDNSGLPSNYILSLAIEGNGTTWIGTDGGGLVTFDGTNWIVYLKSAR